MLQSGPPVHTQYLGCHWANLHKTQEWQLFRLSLICKLSLSVNKKHVQTFYNMSAFCSVSPSIAVNLRIREKRIERISSALGLEAVKPGWGMCIGRLSLQGKLRWRIVRVRAVSVYIHLTHGFIHWGHYTLTALSSIMDYNIQKLTYLPLSCLCVHMAAVT